MTVQSLLLILLGGVLANNYVLQHLLGLAPFLGYSREGSKTVGMGVSVTIAMLVATAIAWPVHTYLLAPNGLAYLQTLVFVAIIAAVVYAANAVATRAFEQPMKLYAPMIALNSAVFGVAVNSVAEGYAYLESLALALGAGLGFLFGMIVLAGIRSRIDERAVPKAFRGLPIAVVAASIVSLVIFAFK